MKTLKLSKPDNLFATVALAALLTQFAAPSAFPATYYWDTDGTTAGFGNVAGTWGIDAFLSTNAAGGASTIFTANSTTNDVLNFGTGSLALGATAAGMTVSGAVSVNRINFGFAQHSPAVTLSGGTITLGGASPVIAPSATNGTTISSDILLAADAQFNTPSFGAGGQPTRITFNGVISGPQSVTFYGANVSNNFGTILLNQKNTYSGSTRLHANGAAANLGVQLGTDDALPTTTVLTLDGGNAGNTAGGRYVRLDLNGFNQTVAGLATVTRGARRDQCVVNSASALAATLTVNNGAAYTYSGQLGTGGNGFTSGPNFGLRKDGAGKLTLSPANTNSSGTIINLQYTGPTTVNNGVLEIAGAGRLGNGSYAADVSIASGAALVFTSTNNGTLSGLISGAGGLTNAGGGTLTLAGKNALPVTTVNAGSVAVSSGGEVFGAVAVNSGGTLRLSGGGIVNGVAVNNGGKLELPGTGIATNLVFTNAGSMSFDVVAGGALTVATVDGITNEGPAGSITVNVTGAAPADGTYPLIAYSGSLQGSGFSAYQLGATPLGKAYSLADSGSVVQLVVSTPLIWTGAQSSEWSLNPIGGLLNWTYQGTPVDYVSGSGVLFDDTLTGSSTVDVSVADVTPMSVTLNHATTNYTLQGSRGITGAASLIKSGAATLTVLNNNSYTGPTIISAGTVQVGSGGTSGTLGSGAITDNGALQFNRSDAITIANPISGTGSFAQNGSGTLTLSGANTYGGATTISAGTLQLGGDHILPDGSGKVGVTVDGTLDLNTFSETINGLGGSGIVDTVAGGTPTLAVGGNNASSTFSGVIRNTSGTLALNKIGSGTLTLVGANTYGGDTTISGGIITAANDSALGTGAVTFNGGTRLVVSNGVTVNNPIAIGLNVGATGRGLIEPASGAQARISGPITITDTPTAGGHLATSGAGALLDVAGPITSSVQISIRIGTVRFSGGGAGYTNLALNQGTAMVGANDGISPTAVFSFLSAGAGILDLNGFNQSLVGVTKQTATATIGNSSTTSDSTLTTTGTSIFGGTIQDVLGSGTMKVNLTVNGGALTLSGTNTYSGPTAVNAGMLLVNGATGPSVVTVNTGGTLGGNGSIGGELAVNPGAVLSPGVGTNAGRLSVQQFLNLASGATLSINLNGTNDGAYDQLFSNTDIFLQDPTLVIALGYTPAPGDQYAIVISGPTAFLAGQFAGLPDGATLAAGGYLFRIQYFVGNGNDIVLTCLGPVPTATVSGSGPLSGASFPLTFSGPSGVGYQVLTSTNVSLPLASWTVLTTGTFGPGPVTYTDTSATNHQQYYIIKSP
jgi:autotransporter-associated beta strand protein